MKSPGRTLFSSSLPRCFSVRQWNLSLASRMDDSRSAHYNGTDWAGLEPDDVYLEKATFEAEGMWLQKGN